MTTTALMVSLLAWLGAHTGYALPSSEAALPTVHFRTAHELRVLSLGSEEKARAHSSRDIRALYDHRTNRMFLSSEFDVEGPDYKAALLHELTHFLQVFNGKRYSCLNESELEAYELTNAWITETGAPVPLYDTLFIKMLVAECSFPSAPPN